MTFHRVTVLALATSIFAACGPGAVAGWASTLGLVLAVGISWRLAGDARSGARLKCTGYEVTSCIGTSLVKQCCPRGAKCNFRNPPHIQCGHNTCVVGADPGRCPSPQARVVPAKHAKDCRGRWEPACIDRTVTKACIMTVPTNYSGPGMNPPFRTCGTDRCTTHVLLEDCFPTRKELGKKATCDGTWAKVCLAGAVEDRCVPKAHQTSALPATQYVTCKDGSCAVGTDRACPH